MTKTISHTVCQSMQPELKAYLDGMLPPFSAFKVRRHLKKCQNCRKILSEVERIGKELRNVETEMETDAGKLDAGLRARILAAIPYQHLAAPEYRRNPIRRWPVLAIGALAAAALAVVIILPQHQKSLSFALGSSGAISDKAMLHAAQSRVARDASAPSVPAGASVSAAAPQASTTTNAPAAVGHIQGLYANDQSATAAGGAQQAADSEGDKMAVSIGGGVNSRKSAFSGGRMREAPVTPGANGRAATGGFAGSLAKASSPVASVPSRTGSSFASGNAVQKVSTFTTGSLEQGERLVRHTVASFKGAVAGPARTTGSNSIELTITVPSPSSAAFLASIPAMSGGELRALTSPSTADGRSKWVASNIYGNSVSPAPTVENGALARSNSNPANGKIEDGLDSVSGKLNRSSRKAENRSNDLLLMASPQAPIETLIIVLVKPKPLKP